MKYLINHLVLFALLGINTACSTLPRNPVPIAQMSRAEIPGMSSVRAWSDEFSEQFETDLLQSIQQEGSTDPLAMPDPNILLLSGGGDYGAFGAGFMHGWSQSGSRPTFKLVTGISTGALIAPFAFLGPEYDNTLKQIFTTVSTKDIYIAHWISFLWSDAFTDSTPLAKLIAHYITHDVVQAIAQAHRQGRRLYIGTTNLDADRLVVWNMGVIANSGHADALKLFRQIILASSSIPGAFPPVLVKVDIDGVSYDEMHVDGGVKAQLFLLEATLDLADFRQKLGVPARTGLKGSIFVIRNAEVGPEPKQVPRNLTEISKRAVSSLIKAQALNDLKRIYELTKKQGLDFNWVALPEEYEPSGSEEFDTEEMNKLYKLGHEMGREGNIWRKVPPGLNQR